MAESASAANQPCHTRSISLPSRSHPAALRVEEELHKLRSSMAAPSSTPEKMCDGLRRLEGVYESVNQQILIHPLQRRWAEEETDGSIRLLDVCSAVKDRLAAMREHIRDLQLALGKNDEAAIVREEGGEGDEELLQVIEAHGGQTDGMNMRTCRRRLGS